MDQDRKESAGWKIPISCLVSAAVALVSPFALLVAALMGTPLIMLSAIVLAFIYGYGGKKAYIIGMVIQIVGAALLLGNEYMVLVLLAGVLPSIFMVRGMAMQLDFPKQLRIDLAASIIGAIIAAFAGTALVGRNIIDWIFKAMSDSIHSIPQEYQDLFARSFTALDGTKLDAAAITSVFDGMMVMLLPQCKLRFPAALIGGAILTAVLSSAIGNRLCGKRVGEGYRGYMPLQDWALPGSMTLGLLLILLVSYILYAAKVNGGEATLIAVLTVAECAFCIQTFGSLARRSRAGRMKRWQCSLILVLLIVGILLGCEIYIAMFGCLSALFGSRGLLRQRMRNRKGPDNSDNSDNDTHQE